MIKKELIFLLIILGIAAFFRLWQLDLIPPGLYPDVAIYGNDALETLRTGNFKVFYPENNGREGLFMWLLALSFSIFGVSIWSIKIVAATFGILTVLGLYLLTKELFRNLRITNINELRINYLEIIALLSSFFLAISFWHTNFSRLGFRAILLPFILVFAFYFLFKALNYLPRPEQTYRPVYRTIFPFVLAGIIFGLGFYTYSSFRMAILILPFIFIPHWFLYKKENLQKKFLFSVFCFLFSIFIVALPIGIYFLSNPQDFVGRAAPISIFAAENPIKEFAKSLILHLGMFNFYGDQNWRHNFASSPQLPWSIGIFFLIGLFLSIRELIKFQKHKNLSLVIGHLSLVIWFFIMLLPGILTTEGIPHALRTIGAIPPTFIFAGIGGNFLYQKLKYSNVFKNIRIKRFLTLGVIFFLIFLILSEYQKYFVFWAKNPETKNAFSADYLEMGNYLNSLAPEIQKYVIVNVSGVPVPWPDGLPMPAQTVMFIESTKYGQPQSIYLLPKDLEKINIKKETIIMPMGYEKSLFDELSKRFPEGEILKRDGGWIYKVNF